MEKAQSNEDSNNNNSNSNNNNDNNEEASLIEGIQRIQDLLSTQLGEIKESRQNMQELIVGMKESSQNQENYSIDLSDQINQLKQKFEVLQKNDLHETQELEKQANQISQEDQYLSQQFQQLSEAFQKN